MFFFPPSPGIPGTAEAQEAPRAGYYYERGRAAMAGEDWYGAAENFVECLALNPAHAEAAAALAECYYELGEFDESLNRVRKARTLARANLSLANLEASILISLGSLDEAARIVGEVLAREPYNREALFTAAELDIARNRAGDAVLRFGEAVKRYPDDRRLLISMALVLGSLGETEKARSYIERALVRHGEDYRVHYYAAYLGSRSGRYADAIRESEAALYLRPGYGPARTLLASLRYRTGQYEEAARLADELISKNREDGKAWYLKGMSYIRLGRPGEAVTILSTAAAIDPEDEFIRGALEETLIASTALEDPVRRRWAGWHFQRAREYRSRNLLEQALFEYRRGLRLNPYAGDRREYADLLRVQGYPSRYLEELRFLQDQGLGDKTLNDAVESYNALLGNALFRRWEVDPVAASGAHWKVAVFSAGSQSSFFHADAAYGAASYVKDILVHERNIAPMDMEIRQGGFSQAFRTAREGGADYFLILSVEENERDISLRGELFVARTGAAAARFNTYRTGADRLRYAGRGIVEALSGALPFRGELIRRRQSQGLIDKGRADGVKAETEYLVVRRGGVEIKNEGIGLAYSPEDVVGTFTVGEAGEEVAAGVLNRSGFFDRIALGDEVLAPAEETGAETGADAADPELRSLLRTLRIP
jgi:tetratricopeptide (TPR) repeat protein